VDHRFITEKFVHNWYLCLCHWQT